MSRPAHSSWSRWLPWIFGVAILATVVIVALHVSEWTTFVHVLAKTSPAWILLATLLQIFTYVAQGEVFRAPPRASGSRIAAWFAAELSLVKVFVDQALPSAGISSTVFISKALEQRGMPRPIVSAAMVLNLVSYNVAYIVCLLFALSVTTGTGRSYMVVIILAVLFLLFAVALVVCVIAISTGHWNKQLARFNRFPVVRNVMSFLEDADAGLTKSPRLLFETSMWQVVIFVFDAATMWVLVYALGVHASVKGVYASFMISNLLRTMGFVPGGLGTFEATSVLTLKLAGVAIPVALSATLLFRGLTFWLPMLPGLWLSKRIAVSERRKQSRIDGERSWTRSRRREFLARRTSQGTT